MQPQKHATLRIRRALEPDAEALVHIMEGIASERICSAIHTPWSAEEQRTYLHALSAREAVHLAETEGGGIVGYQTLELWAPALGSMAHVGQIGTFLLPEWRRHGIGEALFQTTLDFARTHGFLKFVIQVRSSNHGAQAFYRYLGFRDCGLLRRQVRIAGQEDDEVLLEFFL